MTGFEKESAMGVYLGLVDFDQSFKMLRSDPVILNDLKFYSEKERELVIQKFLTKYTADAISTLPQCECGALQGEYLLGEFCKECQTVVVSDQESSIEPVFWLRSPAGVAPLVNPVIWSILRNNFVHKRINIIDYLTNTNIPEPTQFNGVIEELKKLNVQRGYNYFIENFESVINILANTKEFKKAKKKTLIYFNELLQSWSSSVFSQYIPVPHRDLLVIENVKGVSKVDEISKKAMEAFNLMAGIDKKLAHKSLMSRMNRTSLALSKISEYYYSYYGKILSPKEGIFRHHIYSSRSHFSFRAVITSLTAEHHYDELHIPWGVAIGVLKIHIMNKLKKMGYDYNKALGFVYQSVKKYDPLMDQILQEILHESPGGYIPCAFHRNPTLLMGSIQLLRITKIKNNLNDNTIAISILLMAMYNGDFDGDEMNGVISVDQKLADLWEPLSTFHNIHDMTEPYKITGYLTLSAPVTSMIATWLQSDN